MRQVRTIIVLLALALSGCTAATYDMAGPQHLRGWTVARETGCGGTVCRRRAKEAMSMPHPHPLEPGPASLCLVHRWRGPRGFLSMTIPTSSRIHHRRPIHADGRSPPRKPPPTSSSISRRWTRSLWPRVLSKAAAQLADIMAQIEVLDNDMQSLQRQITALFGLETAPASTSALRERLAEIRRLRWQCYSYAMRLQTLIKTALRTIQHLSTLVNSGQRVSGQ